MNVSLLLSQFRISAAMRPYVLRVKLRGTDFDFGFKPEQAVAYTKCIREMRRILVKKGRISAIAADRAVVKTLEAAFDFQLAAVRCRFLKRMEAQSHTTLDHLIRLLRQLSHTSHQNRKES
jgi:ubiquinone/menaquinone biosynthesis C-methylase UbiE